MADLVTNFLEGVRATSLLEWLAVASGIVSVWFSRRENILVYPVGLISTVIYIYLSIIQDLYGEASVNVYYTIMSIYGWVLWQKRNRNHELTLHVTVSTPRELRQQGLFFLVLYVLLYAALHWLGKAFSANTIPWADGFASAAAFTGMWLMAKKKVESWHWWIVTNFASIPLYYYKGYVVSSVYYVVLLVMAVSGLVEWKRRARLQNA